MIPWLKEKEKCCICLGKYRLFKKTYVTTCGHKFHIKCIKKWLENKTTCPLCNHFLRIVDINRKN